MNFKVGRFKLFLKQIAILVVLFLNIPLAHSMFIDLPGVPGSHVKVKVFQASSLKHHLLGVSKELKEACLHNQILLTTLTQSVGLGKVFFEPIEDFPRFLSEAEPMLLLHEILGSQTILPFDIFSLTSIQEGKTEEKFVKASPMIRGTKLSHLKDVEKKSAWERLKSINSSSFSDIFLIRLLMNSLYETGDNLLIDGHGNFLSLTVPSSFLNEETKDSDGDQNILYCLTPLMTHVVSGHVCECLKILPPEVLALRWFSSLSVNGRLSFLPGEIGAFLNRVDKLHPLLNYSPNISHNGIFQEFSPEKSIIYKGAIEQAATISRALEKVKLVFDRFSQNTMGFKDKNKRYPLSERIHELIESINLYKFKAFLNCRLEIINAVALHFFEAGKLCRHESWKDISIIDELLCYPLPPVTVKLLMALRPSPIASEMDKDDLENQQIKEELTNTKMLLSAKEAEIKELSNELKAEKDEVNILRQELTSSRTSEEQKAQNEKKLSPEKEITSLKQEIEQVKSEKQQSEKKEFQESLEKSKVEDPLKKEEREELKGTEEKFSPLPTEPNHEENSREEITGIITKETFPSPQKVTPQPIEQLTPSKQARLIAETLSFLVKEASWKAHRSRTKGRAYIVNFNCPYLKRKKYTVREKQDGFGHDYFEWEDEVFSFTQYVNPKDLRKTLAVHLKKENVTYYKQQRFEGRDFKSEDVKVLVDVYFDSKYQIEYWQEKIKKTEQWAVESPRDFSKAYFSSRKGTLAYVKSFSRTLGGQEFEDKNKDPHLFSPPDMIEAYWETLLVPEKPSLLKTLAMGYLLISPGYLYGLKTFFESWSSAPANNDINETIVTKSSTSSSQERVVHNRGVADDCTTGSNEEVFQCWHTSAVDHKDPTAQVQVAQRHFFGQGVPRDYKKAREWFQKAAEQNHILAQFNVGLLYQEGRGVSRDYGQAMKWYLKAAEQNHAKAQFNVGMLYQEGRGVPRDYGQAMKWYLKAAEQNHAEAQVSIGVLYHEGLGVPRDYEKAMEWYLKAAEQNHAKAQVNIGVLYQEGRGVLRDYGQAMRWYLKAAEQNHAMAQVNMGVLYQEGRGVPRDYEKAMEWYLKSTEQNHVLAQFNMGVLYHEGLGVPRDYGQAMKWYLKAAEQNHAKAQFNMGALYHEGQGVGQDYKKAMKWFQKAAEQNDAMAQYMIGSLYDNSLGIPRDDEKAREWYLKAARLGYEPARKKLMELK